MVGGHVACSWSCCSLRQVATSLGELSGKRSKCGSRAAVAVRAPGGAVALSTADVAVVWRQRFMDDYGDNAVLTDLDSLASQVQEWRDDLPLETLGLGLPVGELAIKVAEAIVSCKNGKAVGPGQVPVELFKAAGFPAAVLLAQVGQAALCDGIPMAWRGGRMAAVPRKSGKPFTYENGRGALCSDSAAKVFARALRKELVPTVTPLVAGWQFGAIGAGGT